MKVFTVYKHTSRTSGKSYIGYTSYGIERRWIEHRNNALRNKLNTTFHCAIRKYGADDWTHTVLSTHSNISDAIAAEIASIAEQQTMYPNGYNMTAGGEGRLGMKMPREHIEKIIKMNKQRTGKKNPLYGKKHKAETIAKMSAARSLGNLNRKWITNGTLNRFVTQDELEEALKEDSWRLGRSSQYRSRLAKEPVQSERTWPLLTRLNCGT